MTKPYYKIIVTNHIIEVYEIEKEPMKPDFDLSKRKDDFLKHVMDADLLAYSKETNSINLSLRHEAVTDMRVNEYIKRLEREEEKQFLKEKRRAQTLRDARNTCRRLAIANFDENSFFITLTYAENMGDVDRADKDFKKFIQRFKYEYGAFDYIAVREFQERGAIHFHMICNADLGWEDDKELKQLEDYFGIEKHEVDLVKTLGERLKHHLWGLGFVDIQRMNRTKREGKNVDNVGAYLTKYMSKEFDDTRLQGCKAYLCSKGLERPKIYKGLEAEKLLNSLKDTVLKQKKETYTNSYASEYLGKIVYKEYNLKRAEKQ